MQASDQARFDQLYAKHLTALKCQGQADKTIDSYARAVRRVARVFDRCPDDLSVEELQQYFADLIDSHSWSMVKIDRNGLRFFHEQVLGRDMPWVEMFKAPKVQALPDILTQAEIARIIRGSRELRYPSFWWVAYRMGLRLSEALYLQVGDIDRGRMQVHVRLGKPRLRSFCLFAGSHAQGTRAAVAQPPASAAGVPGAPRRRWRARPQSHGPRRHAKGLGPGGQPMPA